MNSTALSCPEQLAGTANGPRLLGNRCRACGEPFFPAAKGCTRCTAVDLEPVDLGDRGSLWSWTVQMFEPKAPYDGAVGTNFVPFGVGYVALDCGLKVESRLVGDTAAGWTIGQPMRLVLDPYRIGDDGQPVFTFAFEAGT